jgi:hypothetical protein
MVDGGKGEESRQRPIEIVQKSHRRQLPDKITEKLDEQNPSDGPL